MFIIYFFITLCDIPITFPLYFQRGSTFGQTQHSNVFGSACNALHSIIATIMFALGDGFCWIWANAILLKIDCCQQVLKVCQETEVSVQWNGTEMYHFLFDRKSWKVCLSQTNYPDVEQRSSKEHHCSRYFPGELWLFRLWIVILRMRARGGWRRS